MPLKRHHKIIIGGFSSFLIFVIVANSLFIYFLYGQLQLSYNSLNTEIIELKTDTQSKLNEMTSSILQAEEELNSLGSQIGSIDKEITLLKSSTSADFSGIIEDAIKGVVTVKTDIGQGTGFIISSEGYIVTNAHVIGGAKAAGIITYEGELHQVELIGKNEYMDIALLKISGDYDMLELADSDDIQIGEKVIAIGNPLGLQFSVSEGIVSGVHRPGLNEMEVYIQTDAALNPGNSGGPLINKEGEVIGINNFKIGGTEGMGFALESNSIEETVNEIAMLTLGQSLI
jgi:serine protease Do